MIFAILQGKICYKKKYELQRKTVSWCIICFIFSLTSKRRVFLYHQQFDTTHLHLDNRIICFITHHRRYQSQKLIIQQNLTWFIITQSKLVITNKNYSLNLKGIIEQSILLIILFYVPNHYDSTSFMFPLKLLSSFALDNVKTLNRLNNIRFE